jgi:predicted metal-dependent phosphoesterase TrpH
MQDLVDLHLHSTYSDGVLTPAGLVARAAQAGLRAIAIADHDNVEGIPEAVVAGRQAGVEVLSGVELSVVWQDHHDIHLLGYDFDHNDAALRRALEEFRDFRTNRSHRILDKVNERLVGQKRQPLEFGAVATLAGGTLGRPHIGQALVNAGHVRSMEEAFQSFLVPCNVAKRYFPVDEAIELLHAAGGCAVLAHPPFISVTDQGLEELVDEFLEIGLDGIEVYNSGADNATIDRHLTLARRRNLIITGGSDFHRDEPNGIQLGRGRGNLKISYRCVEEIRARSAVYRGG